MSSTRKKKQSVVVPVAEPAKQKLLHEVLAQQVASWRDQGYPHEKFPAIGEILEWANDPGGGGFQLRAAQLRALETYWYLRLVEDTPHMFDLYQKFFERKTDLLFALGVPPAAFEKVDFNLEILWERIREDDDFVREFHLEVLRETFLLKYASYILALAMGAGKTVLIGAIFATEFAMAFEYPSGPFVKNALVFAPGKTIIESLRQLAETPYERILPPRFYKQFAASARITFTRDGERDIPVIRKSLFNVIVTNTEKIRIQKENVHKIDLGRYFTPSKEDEAKTEVANLRLQAIASLPHLAVFSDEAHHTYGQSLDTDLKKVRKTVDYLAQNTTVICVINTTGTPYFHRVPLLDVVVWYGLSEGIKDHILKQVAENIKAYSFENNIEGYLSHVIEDFFRDYGDVTLPDGTPAKLAMYFPQTNDVSRLRPIIDAKLVELGLSPTLILEHHTKNENKDDFDRFKLKDSPHRIALLVDRGVEGWDVPALFACALARRLKTSNNFVLQAASRCLRQVPGNNFSARIYLSNDNRSVLDKELRENFGETLEQLTKTASNSRSATIRLRKLDIPDLVVKQVIRTVVRKQSQSVEIKLNHPEEVVAPALEITTLTVTEQNAAKNVLQQVSDTITVVTLPKTIDVYSAAVELAAIYCIDLFTIYDELRRLYGNQEIPLAQLTALGRQIEEQTKNYEIHEDVREVALALVKVDGFEKSVSAEGTETYTAEISYPLAKQHLIVEWEKWKDKAGEFGFHYTPYNFDSTPELSFFEQFLRELRLESSDIEDIYFTGAITSPSQTDFFVEYKGVDEKWHRYTPDFVIRCKNGRCLIVEIKDPRFEAATQEDLARNGRGEAALTVEGRKAVALKKWESLDPNRLKYELIFASSEVSYEQMEAARVFARTCDGDQ